MEVRLDTGAYSTITKELKRHFVTNNRTRFIVTGHSLGGGACNSVPCGFGTAQGVLKRLEGVFTFGQPKVGERKSGRFMDEQLERYGVKYYSHDIVPPLPRLLRETWVRTNKRSGQLPGPSGTSVEERERERVGERVRVLKILNRFERKSA
ncbi:unnamed protein product [Fraxinus pennsylvanica]|uniref:Fungal lipase-type domain-containing protein n=1 Tax=Fraxinus pennsylvanica TaxID=56036 RepID=A0AAD1YXL1_9LAMI|nr:unnamed protein product [Fraxinus pennsylvanica]